MGFKEKLVRLSELKKYRTDHLAEVRETWIRELNRLYKEIENWFGEYPEQGCMSIEYCHLRGEYHGCPTVSTNMAAPRASDWWCLADSTNMATLRASDWWGLRVLSEVRT